MLNLAPMKMSVNAFDLIDSAEQLTQWYVHLLAIIAGPNDRAGFKLPPV